MTKLYWIFAVAGLLLTGPALAQGNADNGKNFYTVCQTCHGQNGEGNQALNAPRLAGQHDWYLQRQLQYFKAGIRGTDPKDVHGMTMAPMAQTLPDEQAVSDVVAYIGTLTAPAPAATLAGGDAAQGKNLYAVCQTCHGQNGEGNQALNAPRLAGQHDWYLQRQLQYFKAGIRGTNPQDIYGSTMAPMAQTLPDEQAINDVIAFIGTLK